MSMERPGHPLEQFLRRTFGDTFCAVVTMVLDALSEAEIPPLKIKEFLVLGKAIGWELKVCGPRAFPRGQDPLVLGALIKILLTGHRVSHSLVFETGEVAREIGWPLTLLVEKRIEKVIRRYVSLSYHKREVRDDDKGSGDELMWGWHTFITGYEWEVETIQNQARRLFNRITFDERFIDGLNNSKVIFAGICLGRLNP